MEQMVEHQRGDNPGGAVRLARASMWMLVGVPIGIAFTAVWETIVKTSPTLSSEERIRGWETVVRELPSTLFLFAVVAAGFVLAVRAARHGAERQGERALFFHAAALFFILLIVLGGGAEDVMTTRPATVKWLLFPIEVGVPLGVLYLARRTIRRTPS